MAVKLKGDLEEQAKALLDGQNVTPKRLEGLLTELAQRRAADALRDATPPQEVVVPEGTLMPEMELPVAALSLEEAERIAEINAETARNLPAPEPLAVGLPPSDYQRDRDLMLATIRALEAKIEEIKKPTTAKEIDEAIGAAKLPPPGAAAPPLAGTGPATFPRGVWIVSPLSPKLRFKLCACGDCTPIRYAHYFCSICGSGPMDYRQKYPHGRKMWVAPGGTWGISHDVCSPLCWMQLLAALGVTQGVNDAEPIAPIPFAQALRGEGPEIASKAAEPSFPVMAATSD